MPPPHEQESKYIKLELISFFNISLGGLLKENLKSIKFQWLTVFFTVKTSIFFYYKTKSKNYGLSQITSCNYFLKPPLTYIFFPVAERWVN